MSTFPSRSVDANDVPRMLAGMVSMQTGVVARAGGGQPLATLLSAAYTRVTTVATAGDSVRLPVARVGMVMTVVNRGAASLNVFPATGQSINALAANTALAVAAGASVQLACIANGIWDAV